MKRGDIMRWSIVSLLTCAVVAIELHRIGFIESKRTIVWVKEVRFARKDKNSWNKFVHLFAVFQSVKSKPVFLGTNCPAFGWN